MFLLNKLVLQYFQSGISLTNSYSLQIQEIGNLLVVFHTSLSSLIQSHTEISIFNFYTLCEVHNTCHNLFIKFYQYLLLYNVHNIWYNLFVKCYQNILIHLHTNILFEDFKINLKMSENIKLSALGMEDNECSFLIHKYKHYFQPV